MPADLDYAKVMQRVGLTVGDGPDLDENPDTIWCDGGTVQIVPLNTYVKVAGGSPVPWTGGNAVIECSISDAAFVDPTPAGFDGAGYLLFNGRPFVWVVDLTSTKVNPSVTEGATHQINYLGVTADGTSVSFPSVEVRITAAGDGTSPDGFNDLTVLSPVNPGLITPIIVGPQGDSVAAASIDATTGDLLFTLDDVAATELNAGPIPVTEAATTAAATATTKAGEAATSKTDAETAAATATTKAGEASTSAGTASTKAGEASTSAATAVTAKTDAEAARDDLLGQKGAASGIAPLDGSSKVPAANLPGSTTTAQGTVELATDTETTTGADTTRAVTPAGVKAAIDPIRDLSDPTFAGALSASTGVIARQLRKLYHLDSYNDFFGGGKWVTGQGNTATTTTAAVAVGASVIPVASAAGLSAGVQLVVAEGTANQKIYTVQSVATNDVTIVGTTTHAIASGDAVTPLWTNSSHLTTVGYRAFAYFIANAVDDTGAYVIQGTAPKVTFLGNSWISQGTTVWGDELDDRIPGATAVNAGVAGNTSAQLLARFATDVPTDSDYVVFNEPGVNDDTSTVSPSTQNANLQALVSAIRAIGAIPVYAGHVPLADVPTYSSARQTQADNVIGDGTAFPGVGVAALAAPYSPEVDSLAHGTGALQKVTTGVQNTVFGARAGDDLTTGGGNTQVGREAGTALTSGNNNTGVGHNVHRALATGAYNTAIGQGAASALTGSDTTVIGALAGLLMTTGTSNVLIGKSAGYTPGGVAANATTTGIRQTLIGTETGLTSTGQANDITGIGYRALAGGTGATAIGSGASAVGSVAAAIGYGTSAPNAGSVAIGTDSGAVGAVTVANNEIALGTANHTTRIRGRLQIDAWQSTVGAAGAASAVPATPTKWLFVKDSSGVELVIPAFAKV